MEKGKCDLRVHDASRLQKTEEQNIRTVTYAVSSNVDCFENHVESLQWQSQSCADVGVVVHEGGGSCRAEVLKAASAACLENETAVRVKKVDGKRRSISGL